MKKITLLLLLLVSGVCFSQQKTFKIEWEAFRTIGFHDTKIELPSFQEENFVFDYDKGLQFIAQWESNQFVNEKSAQLKNLTYSNISNADLKGLKNFYIPSQIEFKLSNSTARNNNNAHFEISPIIKENGVYKKLTSFQVTYTFSNQNNNRNTRALSNSVLRSGNWYRFYVERSGVHRISKGFLEGLGVNLGNIDPRTLKIYGNGGQMLPLLNAIPYPIDLTENAIKLVGEEDGAFNNEDHILFYAEGPQGVVNDAIINTNINPYTDRSYYYVNVSSGPGKRITEFNQPTGTADLIIESFSGYQFHEEDEFNIVKLGRRWFGDRFSSLETEKSFDFEIPNIITSEPVLLKVHVGAVSEAITSMQLSVNGTDITNFGFQQINDPFLADVDNSFTGNIDVTSSSITIGLNYNNGGNPSSLAYVDYISVEAKRQLSYIDQQFLFKNYDVAQNTGIAQYTISNATNVSEVWDVTDKYNVTHAVNAGSESAFSFKAAMGSQRYYQAVDGNYYEPLRDSNVAVANQDIKGSIFLNAQGQFQDVDYIIVSPNNLLNQANRLAQINRDQYNLNVKVVTLKEIYTEFSSGNQDIGAIRNMVKYVYDNASIPENAIKYVCLFGDASYDYKDRISGNTNIVPTWHAYRSGNLTNSFVSDDFYGLMDDNEGFVIGSDRLDIAVGRILVESPQRAKDMVDKIELYYQKEAYGSWRNNLLFIADDIDASWEKVLQGTTDIIADEIITEKNYFNATKIYADAFQQESSAGGDRYPQVTTAIADAIEVGALVVNYFGHGGEDGLAKERVFEQNDVQNLRNICKFNCFVTITCEYTKFDNPQRPTAGEYTYWNKDGGSIALITTTRQVFVTTGVSINVALAKHLFAYGSSEYPSMAEALRRTKIEVGTSQPQRRLVFFIGDPAMKLAAAGPSVRLTTINDVPIDQTTDVLQALSYAKIAGEVTDETGNVLSDYNGTLSATIFDKKIQRQTLANDGVSENGQPIVLDFETLGEIIFRGQATIANGQFEFDFIVPRDIGIPVGQGKVSFYAKTENPLSDQAGASLEIQIGGLNENAEEDNIGPTIQLFMNDENFVSGGITNESPTLLAKLQDEHGINTASGIGHDIVAIIDGDETNPFVLNDYYETELDDYKNGKVSYPFRDLESGIHTLTLKAWDVYNNSSTADIQFVVFDKDKELAVNNVLNYPNPFINYTEFWFNHNSVEPLDVSVQIFTVSGKLVRTINGKTKGGSKVSSSLSRELAWDGRDDFGDKIGKGVYVYKLTVKSNTLNKKVEKYEKLVIL